MCRARTTYTVCTTQGDMTTQSCLFKEQEKSTVKGTKICLDGRNAPRGCCGAASLGQGTQLGYAQLTPARLVFAFGPLPGGGSKWGSPGPRMQGGREARGQDPAQGGGPMWEPPCMGLYSRPSARAPL